MDLAVEAAPDRSARQPLEVHGVGAGDLPEGPARVASEVEDTARRRAGRSGGQRGPDLVVRYGLGRAGLPLDSERALCFGAFLIVGGTGARASQDPPGVVEGGHAVMRSGRQVRVVFEREGPVGGSDDLPLCLGIDLEDLVQVAGRHHQRPSSPSLGLVATTRMYQDVELDTGGRTCTSEPEFVSEKWTVVRPQLRVGRRVPRRRQGGPLVPWGGEHVTTGSSCGVARKPELARRAPVYSAGISIQPWRIA